LKKTAKKKLVYTKDILKLNDSKPARETRVSEQISIAKKNIENPEVAINHVRTALSLLIQQKFGFDATNLSRFVKICGEFGVHLPRNLMPIYDLGSKNIHRGLVPSTSDVKAAIVFVEELELEFNQLSIEPNLLNQIRSKCETEGIIFKGK